MAAGDALMSAFRPVERGVTGAERLFQQSRNFGPGPISPHPPGYPNAPGYVNPYQRAREQQARRNYTGGSRPRAIPSPGRRASGRGYGSFRNLATPV